jgi:uncharacterized protein
MRVLKLKWGGCVLIALSSLCGGAGAQEPAEKLPPSIRVTGEAVVNVRPDRAQIDIGVVTQGQTAKTAAAQNAQRLDAVLAELRRVLGANASIKTVNYALSPNYNYSREGGRPTISGYTATNTVRVTLDDLTEVGKVIDAVTQSGANQIYRLAFTLKDEPAAQAQALREAATKARARAEALAAALNVTAVRVLSAVENSGGVAPLERQDFMARDGAAAKVETPVEPGTIEVRASVTLTVEIKARQ